jgi:hypothetical protein
VVGCEVAARCHVDRRMGIDGPADCHVDNMSSDEPCDDEYAKGDVASSRVAHVFKQFRGLLLSALVTTNTFIAGHSLAG